MPNDGRTVSGSFDKTWSLGHLVIAASVLLPSLTAIFLAGSWFERVDESIQALLQQERTELNASQAIADRQADMMSKTQTDFDALKDQLYALQTQVYTFVLSHQAPLESQPVLPEQIHHDGAHR